jgi:hypothetical protein
MRRVLQIQQTDIKVVRLLHQIFVLHFRQIQLIVIFVIRPNNHHSVIITKVNRNGDLMIKIQPSHKTKISLFRRKLKVRIIVVNKNKNFLIFASSDQVSRIRRKPDIRHSLAAFEAFRDFFPVKSKHDPAFGGAKGKNDSSVWKSERVHRCDRVAD